MPSFQNEERCILNNYYLIVMTPLGFLEFVVEPKLIVPYKLKIKRNTLRHTFS